MNLRQLPDRSGMLHGERQFLKTAPRDLSLDSLNISIQFADAGLMEARHIDALPK